MPDSFNELPFTDEEALAFAKARDIIQAQVRQRMDDEFTRRIGYYRHITWTAFVVSLIALTVMFIGILFIQSERRAASDRACTRTFVLRDALVTSLERGIPLDRRPKGSFAFNLLQDLRNVKC